MNDDIANNACGVEGESALYGLRYFDLYKSFTCDTLHTLYIGVVVRFSPTNIFLNYVALSNRQDYTKSGSVQYPIELESLAKCQSKEDFMEWVQFSIHIDTRLLRTEYLEISVSIRVLKQMSTV